MRWLLSVCAFSSLLLVGATPNDQPVYRAYAASLHPAPIVEQPPVEPVVKVEVVDSPTPPKTATTGVSGATGGSRGYLAPGNNCVTFVCRMAPGLCQNGNAGTWRANSSAPSLGAVMIFRPGQLGAGFAGHVGIVVGINGNGTVNLAHANCPFCPTTYPSTGLFAR